MSKGSRQRPGIGYQHGYGLIFGQEKTYVDEPKIEAPDDCLKPDWSSGGRIHNWKNYISDQMQREWDTFTDRQKALIASSADEQAGDEQWD